jgi:HEAT repeat protein
MQLGTNASTAVPELTAMMQNTKAPNSSCRAMSVLGHLGTNGLVALTAAAKDPKFVFRATALSYVYTAPIMPESSPLVTRALIQCINDPSLGLVQRGFVAMWLGIQKIEPELSVPALTDCVASTNTPPSVREDAVMGLISFGKARQALPILTNMLTSSDPTVRTSAAKALSTITGHPPNAQSQ